MSTEEQKQEEVNETPVEATHDATAETQTTSENTAAETNWEEKYKETYDNYLRIYSEFDNYRKRSMKEKAEWIKTAGSDMLIALLPVMDDFERALKSMENATDIKAVHDGIHLIYQKFKNTLGEKGLTEVPALGEVFNADIHEAVTHIPAADEASKGKVFDVLEKGYAMNDKIIRYPKVVVAS